jgi:hypothetical protein
MTRFFRMDPKLFLEWKVAVRQDAVFYQTQYDISESKFGLRLINVNDRSFELVNHKKYMTFLLRYQ